MRLGKITAMINNGKTDLLEWSGLEINSSLPEDAGLWDSKWWLLNVKFMTQCRMPLSLPITPGRSRGRAPGLKPGTASYYTCTLGYKWRRWQHRFDATSKVQWIGGPFMHSTGSRTSSQYSRTVGALRGALAPATPRTLVFGVQIPHRACIDVAVLYSYVILHRHIHLAMYRKCFLEAVLPVPKDYTVSKLCIAQHHMD